MKINKLLICSVSAIFIIIFTFLSTMLWYKFFEKRTDPIVETKEIYISNNSEQVIQGVDLETSFEPYKFNVENKSAKKINYKLVINDVLPSLINDGCNENSLLNRNQLIYELKLNDEVIVKDEMKNIKDNILDIRNIPAKSSNSYEIIFSIKDSQDDYFNKHYHYEINLLI